MENVLEFWLRSSAVLLFVLALSIAAVAVSLVDKCTLILEDVMEYDDVLHGSSYDR